MRRSMKLIPALAVLGGVLTGGLISLGAAAQDTSPADHPIVGAWMVSTPGGPSIAVFSSDGTVVMGQATTSTGPMGLVYVSAEVGAWEAVDDHTAHFTAVQLLSDASRHVRRLPHLRRLPCGQRGRPDAARRQHAGRRDGARRDERHRGRHGGRPAHHGCPDGCRSTGLPRGLTGARREPVDRTVALVPSGPAAPEQDTLQRDSPQGDRACGRNLTPRSRAPRHGQSGPGRRSGPVDEHEGRSPRNVSYEGAIPLAPTKLTDSDRPTSRIAGDIAVPHDAPRTAGAVCLRPSTIVS